VNLPTNTELFDRLGDPDRMRHIAAYDIFHPDLRDQLDSIATRSAHRLHAPVSLVSILLDSAQLIIGRHGLPDTGDDLQGTPAEWAMCTHTVLAGSPFCLSDATADAQHADNPLLATAGLRSYAGVPLLDDSGHVLGAHCVLDATARNFTEEDIAVLTEGATEIRRILDGHRVT
jgi:GAF domain-containing protein